MALGRTPAKVTVMGLGLFGGGEGAVRFWADLGSEVTVTDLKTEEDLAPSLEHIKNLNCRLVLGRHDESDFINADIVVVNPAVKPDDHYISLAREHGAKLITEIGTLIQLVHGPIFGVTGSNGKSTTTALLGNILRKLNPDTLIGGNIGGSLLDDINSHSPTSPVVLELSSFQLHYLADQEKSPNIAVITNLSSNHLDWHKSKEEYYAAKKNIFAFQWPEDVVVLNNDDHILKEWAEEIPQRVALFGVKDPDSPNAAFLKGDSVIIRIAGLEHEAFNLSGLNLRGQHNIYNALAAALAADIYMNDTALLKEGIRTFKGLEHRLEFVEEIGGVKFFNDTVSTTPESTIAALSSFNEPVVLIAGGYDKGMDLDPMSEEIAKKSLAVILIGDTREKISAQVLSHNPKHKIIMAENMAEAVIKGRDVCPEGGVVVLSPGCASYGLFRNFEERGLAFKKEVNNLF